MCYNIIRLILNPEGCLGRSRREHGSSFFLLPFNSGTSEGIVSGSINFCTKIIYLNRLVVQIPNPADVI